MTDVPCTSGAKEGVPHPTPAAFNAAITARLKVVAKDSPYTVSQLRRQFAYDRLLARVFTVGDTSWILQMSVNAELAAFVAAHRDRVGDGRGDRRQTR